MPELFFCDGLAGGGSWQVFQGLKEGFNKAIQGWEEPCTPSFSLYCLFLERGCN